MRVESGADRGFIDLGGRSRLDKIETQKREVEDQEAVRVEARKAEKQAETTAAITGRLVDKTV